MERGVRHGVYVSWDDDRIVVNTFQPQGMSPAEAVEVARLLLTAAKQAQENAAVKNGAGDPRDAYPLGDPKRIAFESRDW